MYENIARPRLFRRIHMNSLLNNWNRLTAWSHDMALMRFESELETRYQPIWMEHEPSFIFKNGIDR